MSFGHSPPAYPGGFTPFGPPERKVTVTWEFSCGHDLIEEKVLPTGTFSFYGDKISKYPTAKCPECIEAEEDRHLKEREAARAKEEETLRQIQEKKELDAKAKRHDEQAMNVYKKQAAQFQLQIDSAGDNVHLRQSQEKMLRTCNLLWSGLVQKLEIAKERTASAETMSKTLLMERLEKVNLLVSRAEILHQQEPESGVKSNKKKKVLAGRLKAWKDISVLMKQAAEAYDSKVVPYLTAVENVNKTSNKTWDDAVKLMKEM